MKHLQNKVALVTGGSRGIGAAIAKQLAKDGARVAITYNASKEKAEAVVKDIQSEGGSAIAIQSDHEKATAVKEAVEKTAAELGGLDILVNNAGIGMYKDISAFTIEEFDQVLSVNVKAVFVAVQAALAYLPRGGRIITIGSCQAERIPTPGGAVYAMSKSALIGFTKGIARDLGKKGITANLVHPGPVDTDMNPANGDSADDQRSLMALSDFGKTEEIASIVSFLAGPESSYITGTGILADGGTNA